MSTGEQDLETPSSTDVATRRIRRPRQRRSTKLDIEVQISDVGPCKKHLKVAIAHGEIERQFKESIGTLQEAKPQVPGFRPGRAPRQLVEKRFRKEVSGQVKSTLLIAALEQIDEDYKLNPITQPTLDMAAIELPEEGPMRVRDGRRSPARLRPAELQGPEGQAAGQDHHRRRRREPADPVP